MGLEIIRLPASGFRRTPWKNGGGTTIDIADAYRTGAEPGSWSGMVWRFGRTSIVEAAPFSDLTGFERVQVVVGGRGLRLHVADGRLIDVTEPLRPVRFSGSWPITSELTEGAVEVLNLIGDERAVALDLAILRDEAVDTRPGETVIYAFERDARVSIGDEGVRLAGGDALRFAAPSPTRIVAAAAPVAVAAVTPRS